MEGKVAGMLKLQKLMKARLTDQYIQRNKRPIKKFKKSKMLDNLHSQEIQNKLF